MTTTNVNGHALFEAWYKSEEAASFKFTDSILEKVSFHGLKIQSDQLAEAAFLAGMIKGVKACTAGVEVAK